MNTHSNQDTKPAARKHVNQCSPTQSRTDNEIHQRDKRETVNLKHTTYTSLLSAPCCPPSCTLFNCGCAGQAISQYITNCRRTRKRGTDAATARSQPQTTCKPQPDPRPHKQMTHAHMNTHKGICCHSAAGHSWRKQDTLFAPAVPLPQPAAVLQTPVWWSFSAEP